jgi:hypothetical protein
MYQLSQAIAAGSVKLQDWNSVSQRRYGWYSIPERFGGDGRSNGHYEERCAQATGPMKNVKINGEAFASVFVDPKATPG